MTGIENSIPADVGNINGLHILHQVVVSGRAEDGGTPHLELLHLVTEAEVQHPVLGGLAEPALVQH